MSSLKIWASLFANYSDDFRRFFKWSSANRQSANTQEQLKALMTMDYHRLEKGLALKEPKIGFGQDVILRLKTSLPYYLSQYGIDQTLLAATNALQEYYDFNLEHGLDIEGVKDIISNIKSKIPQEKFTYQQGGTIQLTKQSIWNAGKIDLANFFNCRYSIRNFSAEEVTIADIEKAVKMAQKTPSVCNRQSCKVYVFSGQEVKNKILSLQNGNRGFGDQSNKLLIVTSSLEHFTSVGERNQGWIDGGMFSMSLVYAFHSLGIGTCCLNWSVTYKKNRSLKEVAGIPESDLVMMIIAVGHLPETLKVAQSPRKPLEEVLIIN